jgi:hypothetical protein
MISQDDAGNDPRQAYVDFLRVQARQAGLGLRELSDAFNRAQKEQERKAAVAGTGPASPIEAMSISKSHLGRILKGDSLPRQLRPFTHQFLVITSRAGHLTADQHRDLWRRAEELIHALTNNANHDAARTPARRSSVAPQDGSHVETIATLRLEVDLERARHTETRLRYALRIVHPDFAGHGAGVGGRWDTRAGRERDR